MTHFALLSEVLRATLTILNHEVLHQVLWKFTTCSTSCSHWCLGLVDQQNNVKRLLVMVYWFTDPSQTWLVHMGLVLVYTGLVWCIQASHGAYRPCECYAAYRPCYGTNLTLMLCCLCLSCYPAVTPMTGPYRGLFYTEKQWWCHNEAFWVMTCC